MEVRRIKLELETAQWLTVLIARVASGQRNWCGVAQWQRIRWNGNVKADVR